MIYGYEINEWMIERYISFCKYALIDFAGIISFHVWWLLTRMYCWINYTAGSIVRNYFLCVSLNIYGSKNISKWSWIFFRWGLYFVSIVVWWAFLENTDELNLSFLWTWQSVSQNLLVSSPPWDLWLDNTSCWKVAVWKLQSCFCGAPSLTRGWVCSLQCNHSVVQAAKNP
jgi:hypothetical protein